MKGKSGGGGGGSQAVEAIAKALHLSLSSFHKQVGDKNTWWQVSFDTVGLF
jgi:hypothetical protein